MTWIVPSTVMWRRFVPAGFRSRRDSTPARWRPARLLTLCVFLTGLALPALAPTGAEAYRHHTSRIAYREHSPAVFEAARRADRPVFLLISAAWCYWCKYFDEQVLETAEVSAQLNERFVSVFVDSDRRPDLTRRYVRGWPMIVFFAPDGRVVQSFPGALTREDFLSVLATVEASIRAGTARAEPPRERPGPGPPEGARPGGESLAGLHGALLRWVDDFADPAHGGIGDGRKFPLGWLWAQMLTIDDARRDPRRAALVERALDGVLRGLHDPVHDGFFRYAEGRDWTGPHFEKMLDVNAALLVAFHRAHRSTGQDRYRAAADSAASFLLRTLYDPKQGGFFGSQTADPAFYRLPAAGRKTAARRPPVNRDKIAPWNAQAVLALLEVGAATGRQDLGQAARHSLDFMTRHHLGEGGVHHVVDPGTGRGDLPGQLDGTAWTALALVEGHRAWGEARHREAAGRILDWALAHLFDRQRGAFAEAPGADVFPLLANSVMAEALLRATATGRRAEYGEAARRTLAAFAPAARRILDGEPVDAGQGAAEAAFYVRALARSHDR